MKVRKIDIGCEYFDLPLKRFSPRLLGESQAQTSGSEKEKNPVHQQILNYLAPMIGQTTAANLLRHYCVKMLISVEDIHQDQLPQLAEAMRPMLAVWLGSEGAAQVAWELRRLVARG